MRRISLQFLRAFVIFSLLLSVSACDEANDTAFVADVLGHSTSALSGRIAQISVLSEDALGGAPASLAISGQFAEFYGVDEDTVRRSLDLWSPYAGQPVESCEIRDDEFTRVDDWYASRIDLLHAGSLLIANETDELVLEPRLIPGMLPYLGGYTYGTDRGTTPPFESEDAITIWSDGGYDIEDFEVHLELPAPIVISRVNSFFVGSAEAIPVSDGAVLIAWEPGLEEDLVYLSIRPDDPADPLELSCVFADDGEFVLDQELFEELRDHAGSAALRLSIRRARIESIALSGFDSAEAIAIAEHSIVLY